MRAAIYTVAVIVGLTVAAFDVLTWAYSTVPSTPVDVLIAPIISGVLTGIFALLVLTPAWRRTWHAHVDSEARSTTRDRQELRAAEDAFRTDKRAYDKEKSEWESVEVIKVRQARDEANASRERLIRWLHEAGVGVRDSGLALNDAAALTLFIAKHKAEPTDG